jgi:tRNA G37 N-methylase Trm5/tRNA(Phe) wybutosine-synthesizing methylase Tyw3
MSGNHSNTDKDFNNAKQQCLGKRDKSFAGRIDVQAVDICSVLNERCEYYTTSSCAGRAFLYQGHGVKALQYQIASTLDGEKAEGDEEQLQSSHQQLTAFKRFRISHDLIEDPVRYFDLSTLQEDPTGGGDPIRTIGQFEHKEQLKNLEDGGDTVVPEPPTDDTTETAEETSSSPIWLRMEPFVLHVCCRSLTAASTLLAAARPSFKNVGLTTWKTSNHMYIVAIWGDEGLDMPLQTPNATGTCLFQGNEAWLQQLINERFERNWAKIRRFVQGVRALPERPVDEADALVVDPTSANSTNAPRSFDVIGDVALLHTLPAGYEKEDGGDEAQYQEKLQALGEAILAKNKAIKVCVARIRPLEGVERAPGDLLHLAGRRRSPLMTTHTEGGIKCVLDLESVFFSTRMGPERRRLCQQVARGENVLVLFCGVGMEALQIAGRTEATRIVAMEWNEAAVECARKGHQLLERNKSVKCVGAADRLEIMQGNVLDLLPTLPRNHFDRIVAPRPKEGNMDGDLGSGDGGATFLEALLPVLKENGGECHWYDFCADREFPTCDRTRGLIEKECTKQGLSMQVIHVANAGSVAKRQLRVCMDFRLCGKTSEQSS